MTKRVRMWKIYREGERLRTPSENVRNMAFEQHTEPIGLGCDGIRPLKRQGMSVPYEAFVARHLRREVVTR